jgi:uncharacterized membrane protein YdjX (TVP38/TMEM64 family)
MTVRAPERRWRAGPRLRLALLGGAVGSALLLVAVSGSLSSDRVRDWVDGFGLAAPVAFIVLSAALTCAMFPGPLLAGAAGLLFGTAAGFPIALGAATLGAVCAFQIARRAGYDAVEQLAGPRVRGLRERVGRRGFYSVLYARLAPGMPYSAVNYAAGLSPIALRAFAAATAIGAAPRAFAYVALGGSFGNFGSWQTVVAVAVLVIMALVGLVLLRRDIRRP